MEDQKSLPGKKSDLVQQIDVRDLTECIIHLLEGGVRGAFNVTGPTSPSTMGEFVYGVKATDSSEVTWTWIEDYDFLLKITRSSAPSRRSYL